MTPDNIFEGQFPSVNLTHMSEILERNKTASKCCKFDENLTGEVYLVNNNSTVDTGDDDDIIPPVDPGDDDDNPVPIL